MKLLVGLGNPGSAHARQRHNIGFMALDAIVARHGIGPLRRRFQGEAAEGRIGAERVLVLKPQTYMNESGRSVGEAARFYKLGPDEIIVLHDEIDLAPGKVRVKRGGGAAGHNGLKSIAAHLGPDFTRVRIGIGHPGSKDRVHGHVLGDFAKADAAWVEPLAAAIADNAERLVAGDNANFMNEVARATQTADDDAREPAQDRARPDRPAQKPTAGKGRAPSQRALARAGAERSAAHPKAPGAAEPEARKPSPFARLRRLFKPEGGTDER